MEDITLPFVQTTQEGSIFGLLPEEVQDWVDHLSWRERRYVLSLCHLLCAAPMESQAEFLDDFTADGLLARMLNDRDTTQQVEHFLEHFHLQTHLTQTTLRHYIYQLYLHSAQDSRRQPAQYLESALGLVTDNQRHHQILSYVLGFEIIKMMFCMSWSQHERLYQLQRNQEDFLRTYIQPIQKAHRLNHVITPNSGSFFSRRTYFIQQPQLSGRRLVEIAMATFMAEIVVDLGFSVIRHERAFCFDFDYIYQPDGADQILVQGDGLPGDMP
ncbi:MAG: cobyrinic acid a,c-diamide synthase [Prochlorothrix sp.]|nr:cobyrinic acid a,c-diamide synthase [Prochlorothrix sp.]